MHSLTSSTILSDQKNLALAHKSSGFYVPPSFSAKLQGTVGDDSCVRKLSNLNEVWAARALLYQVCCEKYGWQFSHDDPRKLPVGIHNQQRVLMDLVNPVEDASYNFHFPCGIFKDVGDISQLLGYGFLASADSNHQFQIEKYHRTPIPFLPSDRGERHYCREIVRVAFRPECMQLNFIPHLFLWFFNSCAASISSVFMCTSDLFLLNFFRVIGFPLIKANVFFSFGEAPVNIFFADYQKGKVQQVIANIKHYLSMEPLLIPSRL